MKIDFSALEAIEFHVWRISRSRVWNDLEIVNRDGEVRCVRNSEEVGPVWGGGLLMEEVCYRRPQQIHHMVDDGVLKVYTPGLLYCPFSALFWGYGYRSEWNGVEFRQSPEKVWNDAVLEAGQLLGVPSYKIARHPHVRCFDRGRYAYLLDKARHPGTVLRVRRFLEAIGQPCQLEDYPVRDAAIASVARHLRKHSKRMSPDTRRFFEMFAGVDAINSTTKQHATNTTKRTDQPVRRPRSAGHSRVGVGG